MSPQRPQLLRELEVTFAQIEGALRAEAPEQHARFRAMLRALKIGGGPHDELRSLLVEMMRWNLTLQLEHFRRQLHDLAPALAREAPAAEEAAQALRAGIRVIEIALRTAQRGAASGGRADAVGAAAQQAETAAERADRALDVAFPGRKARRRTKDRAGLSGEGGRVDVSKRGVVRLSDRPLEHSRPRRRP